ncbi:MAG: GNAT family N-acetyltransferase [Solobacterium sp.]|nr:GNAT family N-acetyltransferase [Solobacterium sp.]
MSFIKIENDRLILRSLKEQDLKDLILLRNDQCVYRFEPSFLIELQGTPEEALKTIRELDLWKDRQCILGIFEKHNPDVLIGLAELYDFKPSGKVISIGYRLRSEYWGRGIASACVSILLEYIRNNTKVELVTAHVIPDNKASARCLIKNGFQYLLTKTEDWGHDHLDVAEVYTFDC